MAKAKSTKPASAKKPKAKEPIVEIDNVIEQTQEPVVENPLPAPNLRYTSDESFPEPPRQVRIGMKVFELPDAATQREGFYHEHAQKLARTIKAYKLIQPKGK